MTTREKFLMIISLAGTALGVFFVGYSFVWTPLTELAEQKATADDKLGQVSDELSKVMASNKNILKLHPRLAKWNVLSIPPRDSTPSRGLTSTQDQKYVHMKKMETEYERLISERLRANGMNAASVKVTRTQPDQRVGMPPQAPKGQQPLYERMAFKVTANGPQDAVYRALRDIQDMKILHEIRSMSVAVPQPKGKEKPNPNNLELTMLLEALVVNGAEARSTLLPDKVAFEPMVLAQPSRDYSLLTKRSLFTGLASPPPPPKEKPKIVVKEKPSPPPVDPTPRVLESERLEVLQFVKLTMLAYNPNRARWEASFYDQAGGKGEEIRVDTRLFKVFSLYSDANKLVLEGKVVWIDEEQLIFTAEGKYFRARVGDFLDTVWKSPLTSSEVKSLGL
jgi:hypothetical protein